MVGLLLGSFLLGYRFFFIETPSMGTTAPVGSLVISKDKNQYSKDDIISFYRSGKIYTHRIIEENRDGTFKTKGDLNDFADSLPVEKYNIIGSAVFIGKYIGWIWRALPILTIGLIIVYLISCIKRIDEPWRWPIRLIGYSVVVMIATFILNPWMRVQMLGYAPNTEKGANMRIVNTGIFPIRDEKGGRFFAGETNTVHLTEIDDQGRFVYIPRPSLGFWGMVLVALWCLIPLIVALMVDIPDSRYVDELTPDQIAKEKRINFILFAAIIAISVLILVLQLSSLAAFTARISNSQNIARTNSYFTCGATQSHYAKPKPTFAYQMNSIMASHNNLAGTDSQGRARNGQPRGNFTVDRASNICSRDGGTPLVFNGADTCIADSSARLVSPTNFSLEAWFKTSKKSNGKIMGFGNDPFTGDSKNDRNLYIDKNGQIVFGLFYGSITFINSPAGRNYADNNWHHVIVSFSTTAGTSLYLDGQLVANSSSMTRAEDTTGYWKIGCGRLANWRHADNTRFDGPIHFTGSIRNAALYDTILTPFQVKEHYDIGKLY